MRVSCLMATYNRGPAGEPLLAEAVECFLRQTLPPKDRELVILNDTPGQPVRCDAPGIRVLNVPHRFVTLAAKYDHLAKFARSESLAVWDDDDLHLPHRLEFSLSKLGDGDYWYTTRHVFARVGDPWVYGGTCVGHNAAVFRRSLWDKVGGFRGDADWDQKFQRDAAALIAAETGLTPERAIAPESISDPEVYYVYRWGVSAAHVSALPDGYACRGREPIQPCTVVVNPRWREDYLVRAARLVGRRVEY